MKLSVPNVAILKNMSDLMTRELWGAYEDSYKQRILQLKKARPGALSVEYITHPRSYQASCDTATNSTCAAQRDWLRW